MEEELLDITKLRYVLYARKSTTDESRQVRSIGDQIGDCLKLKERLKLNVVDILKEEQSAKKPHKRPIFNQMLNDLRSGKYDGILAWNPDRLARNMLEGGKIIDMIDQEQIKDLKFVTHYFTKDANGKMLLGMAFVLSKQYSDDLSQKVKRGVRSNLEEGKTPTYKYGYLRDQSGLQRPDGVNFDLIRRAWQLRTTGASLDRIAEFLNTNGYQRVIKTTGKKVKITPQMLSDMFKDPFYYGILIQANQKVDLRLIYDFQPAITEQDYFEVQQLSGKKIMPYAKKRLTYIPLRLMITCSYCGNHMYGAASKGNTKRYLFYRCDGKYCTRVKKSIRAKIIFEFIYKTLEKGLNFTENEYQEYLKSIKGLSIEKREKLLYEVHSKEARVKYISQQERDIAYKLIDYDSDSPVRKFNDERLINLGEEKDILKSEVATLREKIKDPEQETISINQFLNLSKNAAKVVQMGDAVVKDVICRLIFLNLSVDEEKVASYQLKPPFDELLKTRNVLFGRGAGN